MKFKLLNFIFKNLDRDFGANFGHICGKEGEGTLQRHPQQQLYVD